MTKNIDKISVDELIGVASVSRPAFYKLFQDKYDLAYSVFQKEIYRVALDAYRERKDFYYLCCVTYQCIKENGTFCRNIAKSSKCQTSFLEWFTEASTKAHLEMLGTIHVSKDIEELCRIYSYGTCAMIQDWILTGMKEDPRVLADLSCRALPVELRSVLLSQNERYRC